MGTGFFKGGNGKSPDTVNVEAPLVGFGSSRGSTVWNAGPKGDHPMSNLASAAPRDKSATRQAKNLNIILGPYRLRDVSPEEANAMARNGNGYIREGDALRLIHSEAFEQMVRS